MGDQGRNNPSAPLAQPDPSGVTSTQPSQTLLNVMASGGPNYLARYKNHKWTSIKKQVDMIEMASWNRNILLSEGRLLNLGNATGHPLFVMSASFTNQVLAQIELWTKGEEYENRVNVLPKHLDEKVVRLHPEKIGVKLMEPAPDQAEYISVTPGGALKTEQYRY